MSVSVNLYPDPRGKKSINKPTGLTNYLFVFTIFAWSVQLINLAHCDVWWQEIKAHVHGYLWLVRQHQSFVSGWGRGYSLHTVLLQRYANYNVYILDTFGQMRKKNPTSFVWTVQLHGSKTDKTPDDWVWICFKCHKLLSLSHDQPFAHFSL